MKMMDRLALQDAARSERRRAELRRDVVRAAAAVAAFLAVLWATGAMAHGPGTDFIWNNPATKWCCSTHHGDCRRVERGEAVEIAPGVWRVGKKGEPTRTFRHGQPGFYESRDLTAWVCQFPGREPTCFFAEPRGF